MSSLEFAICSIRPPPVVSLVLPHITARSGDMFTGIRPTIEGRILKEFHCIAALLVSRAQT
jgi:hypothetical protein